MQSKFRVLETALNLVFAMRPIVERVQQSDKDLASQLRRATSSVPLCLSEGARRTGKDRLHLWRVAAGSAAEVRTALIIAAAWGYIAPNDNAAALQLVDSICAMTWRLTHPQAKQ